jgi:predicted extracellular nuclease
VLVLWAVGCSTAKDVPIGGGSTVPETLAVASWNVENLFDTEDDPANDGDDAFTLEGWVRWSERRYALKLAHLAEIIVQMKPDILCLVEIENRRVLEDLQRTLREGHAYDMPFILHREGPDPRGIDVAMLSRHAAAATNWIVGAATREPLACTFEVGGRRLTVVVNHWKSQSGKKAENDAMRRKDASAVRRFLDACLAVETNAAILVTGDFNDQAASPVMLDTARFVLDRARVLADASGALLYNLSGGLVPEERGTYWYNAGKAWNSFDAVCVTRGMLHDVEPPSPWRVREGTYRIFKTPAQLDEDGHPLPFRFVRSKAKGDAFKTGYSDHFPVRVELEQR